MSDTTTAHDFREVIQTNFGGATPLIVGGHAANIWAVHYEQRIWRRFPQTNLLQTMF
jgi:hypothetical protein